VKASKQALYDVVNGFEWFMNLVSIIFNDVGIINWVGKKNLGPIETRIWDYFASDKNTDRWHAGGAAKRLYLTGGRFQTQLHALDESDGLPNVSSPIALGGYSNRYGPFQET